MSATCGAVPLALVLALSPSAVLARMLALVIVALTLPAVYTSVQFSPWWPTRPRDLDRIARAASLSAGMRFCELGCGDARVSAHLARTTGASGVAIDLSPFHLLLARLRLLLHPAPDLRLVLGDLFAARLDEFDVLYVYGVPDRLSGKFAEKLARDCKRGATVIAYVHPIEGLAIEAMERPDSAEHPIYIYRIV